VEQRSPGRSDFHQSRLEMPTAKNVA